MPDFNMREMLQQFDVKTSLTWMFCLMNMDALYMQPPTTPSGSLEPDKPFSTHYTAVMAAAGSSHSLTDSSTPAAAAATGSSLQQAVSSGDAQQAAVLLQQGADVNSKDQHGQYMLEIAVSKLAGEAMLQVLDALLASPDNAVEAYAAALHRAAYADLQALQHMLRWQQLAEQAVNMQSAPEGYTALQYAAAADSAEVIRLLLRVPGADPNIADSEGFTPLYEAVRTPKAQGHHALQALLGSDKCDGSPGTADFHQHFKRLMPLHWAVAFPQCCNRRLAVQLQAPMFQHVRVP
jgi:hypothetical protein